MANQMGEASEGRPSGTGKPVNSIKHSQSKAVKSWINNELKQQQKRFKKILQNMENLSPKRDQQGRYSGSDHRPARYAEWT